MKITHTSPAEITKITNNGLFGDCLFFSDEEYVMTAQGEYVVYELNIEEDKIINVSALDDSETVQHIMNVLEVDEETAIELLTGEIENAGQVTGDYEDDWFIQSQQGVSAKNMGYEAAEAVDEQGAVYIVPMFGREADLVAA